MKEKEPIGREGKLSEAIVCLKYAYGWMENCFVFINNIFNEEEKSPRCFHNFGTWYKLCAIVTCYKKY